MAGGAGLEDLAGKTDYDFWPAETVHSFYRQEERIMTSGEPLIGQVSKGWHNGEGRAIWLWETKVPLYDAEENIRGLVGISRDITELKEAELELRKAKEEAEVAARTKADFLANMSHEIRTPLNAMIGMTSLLLDTPMEHRQQEYVETIRTSSDTLLNIINNILDFSKIEAGKLELESQPFDLHVAIEETLDLFAQEAGRKNIELAYSLDADVPLQVIGDVTRLRQVLVNLVGNAIKFTDAGEVIVSVEKAQPHGAGSVDTTSMLSFAVRDTGIGIEAAQLDTIFDAFSQADALNHTPLWGNGAGAYDQSSSLHNHGWAFECQEHTGGWALHSTFTVALPVDKSGSKPLPTLGEEHVLILGAKRAGRMILQGQLARWRLKPKTVDDVVEARAALDESTDYSILFVDTQEITEEITDELQRLFEEIRSNEHDCRPQIILLKQIGETDAGEELERLKCCGNHNQADQAIRTL